MLDQEDIWEDTEDSHYESSQREREWRNMKQQFSTVSLHSVRKEKVQKFISLTLHRQDIEKVLKKEKMCYFSRVLIRDFYWAPWMVLSLADCWGLSGEFFANLSRHSFLYYSYHFIFQFY